MDNPFVTESGNSTFAWYGRSLKFSNSLNVRICLIDSNHNPADISSSTFERHLTSSDLRHDLTFTTPDLIINTELLYANGFPAPEFVRVKSKSENDHEKPTPLLKPISSKQPSLHEVMNANFPYKFRIADVSRNHGHSGGFMLKCSFDGVLIHSGTSDKIQVLSKRIEKEVYSHKNDVPRKKRKTRCDGNALGNNCGGKSVINNMEMLQSSLITPDKIKEEDSMDITLLPSIRINEEDNEFNEFDILEVYTLFGSC